VTSFRGAHTFHCDECGYVYDLDAAPGAAAAIVDLSDDLAAHVGNATRPEPTTWSPLEYGCHVRDVLLVQRERVLYARRAEAPTFPPMGRDERVDHDGYASQDPADVARQIRDAARMFANVLSRLGADDWERTIVYNYPPPPRERSLRWVAVHTVHEVRHHLQDVS
jgi:hypothetical protein